MNHNDSSERKWKNKEKIIANDILPPVSSRTIHQLIVSNIQSTADSQCCVCVCVSEREGEYRFHCLSVVVLCLSFSFLISAHIWHLLLLFFYFVDTTNGNLLRTNYSMLVRQLRTLHVLELNENFSMTLSTSSSSEKFTLAAVRLWQLVRYTSNLCHNRNHFNFYFPSTITLNHSLFDHLWSFGLFCFFHPRRRSFQKLRDALCAANWWLICVYCRHCWQ